MMKRLVWGLMATGMAMLFCGAAPDDGSPVITYHEIVIAGRRLAYTAEAGRIPIRDVATGNVMGYTFYVAYRVPSKGKPRPITFMWNGGPGLPAASVEFEGFGPRRIENGVLVDNADTALTDSDLVFVDPMNTGFSRAKDAQSLKAFTNIVGDVAAAAEFVRAFVLRHGDEDSPLILSGQSYGAGRAGSAAYQLLKRGMNVRGIVLVSNSQGLPTYPDRDRNAAAIHVADYAVTAQYFGKLPREFGNTPEAARANAERWVHEIYLPALERIDTLSPAEREAIARELARHTGLAPGDIDRRTLVVTQGFFLGHIMPGRNLYYSDYRIEEPHRSPSLVPGIRSIRHDLRYPSDLPYLGIEPYEDGFAPNGVFPPTINSSWRHTTVYGATDEQIAAEAAEWAKKDLIGMPHYGPELPGAAAAIALDPSVRVMVMHGAYDPLGGCSIDTELARHLQGAERDAIRFHCYASGHAIYRDAPARAAYARDLRALAKEISGEH